MVVVGEMGKSDQGIVASAGQYTAIPRVLVFVFHGNDVLLLKGAPTKRIWANRYNGVGGHVEADEDVYAAARRETREETGLEVHDLRLRGIVNVDVGAPGDSPASQVGILFFVFTARSEKRQTLPSAEGTLEWIPLQRLPQHDMVEDVPILLRRLAETPDTAPPFFARYFYDEGDRLHIAFAEPV
jgi:8-oxo-dGTP diphosphatase